MLRRLASRGYAHVSASSVFANRGAYHLVDVRDQSELLLASIPGPGVTHFPLGTLQTASSESISDTLPVDKDAAILVFCRRGIRSQVGAAILESHGYSNVSSMDGGIEEYAQHDQSIATY